MIKSPAAFLVDPSGKINTFDAFGRLRVSEPYTLIDAKMNYDNLPKIMVQKELNGAQATYTQNESAVFMETDSQAGSICIRQTKDYFNYQTGKSLLIMGTFNLEGNEDGHLKEWGYYDDNDGFFLQIDGTNGGQVNLVNRSSTSGSPVEIKIAQSNWNLDKFDGTGPSGITLDLSKVQIGFIDLQWLGVGSVRMGFVIDGVGYFAHQFNHANIITSVYMQTPNLPVRWRIENVTGATTSRMKQICCTVITEGGLEEYGIQNSCGNGTLGSTIGITGAVPRPIFSIRAKAAYARSTIIPKRAELMCTSQGNIYWAVILNPIIAETTPAAFQVFEPDSRVEVDDTWNGNILGGTYIASGYSSNNNDYVQIPIDTLIKLASDIDGNRDILTVVARSISGNETVLAGITWLEVL
jgi:hypothetical protein